MWGVGGEGGKARATEAAIGEAVDIVLGNVARVETGDDGAGVEGEARVAQATDRGTAHGARTRVARGVVHEDHSGFILILDGLVFLRVDNQTRASLVHEDVPRRVGISRRETSLQSAAMRIILVCICRICCVWLQCV